MFAPSPRRTAALKFLDVLKLMAEDESLTPEVMLHVVGLTSALLLQYGGFSREDLECEIDLTSTDPAALEGLYLAIRAVGLKIEGAQDPEPAPDPEPDPAA